MLKEAVRMGYIQTNPAQEIGIFKEEPKGKTVLSLNEVRILFDEKSIQKVWGGDLYHYTFNLLAATTGMRLGEIQGLQRMYVHGNFVEVVHSWSRNYGLKDTKNHENRPIPIPSLTQKYLQTLMNRSPHQEPEDLVFWGPERTKPFDGKRILEQLYSALGKIDVDAAERKERNITFHSWRYFFNTLCRSRQVSDAKTRTVMGHKTAQMTERYTHLLLEDLSEIRDLQEDMLNPKQAKNNREAQILRT